MPSPLGHALAGIAVGWAVNPRTPGARSWLFATTTYAVVAALPDVDLLWHSHRGPSHGVGMAVLVGFIAWALTRHARAGLTYGLAFASHILLDWLGTDTTPPIGLMALWPLSREYYESPYHVFMAVSRRYWLPEFWTYNIRVLMREALILAPLAIGASVLARRGRRARVLCLGALTLMSVTVFHAEAGQDSPYSASIASYRAGEYAAAVKAVVAMDPAKVEEERKRFERTPFGTLRDDEVRAAIMLHTEAHIESLSGRVSHLPSPHLDRARRLARRCLELLDSPATTDEDIALPVRRARAALMSTNAREFVRQWYLLLASQLQGMRHATRSAHYLQEARFLFPDDPDLLLASGAHHEMLTLVGTGRVPLLNDKGDRVGEERIDPAKELAAAVAYFRAALAANPGLDEAQLRLGRALYLLRDLDGAARELDSTRARATQPAYQYLAAVFLALVEQQRESPKRAAELYIEATKIFPAGQAAFVGGSQLAYVDGQAEQAATMIKTVLERPAAYDPWWSYITGQWWHFDARLAMLRAQARQ